MDAGPRPDPALESGYEVVALWAGPGESSRRAFSLCRQLSQTGEKTAHTIESVIITNR